MKYANSVGGVAVAAAVALAAMPARAAVRTVAADETVEVTDANVADFADGIAFADATGVVEFNTSSAPTMNITGAGTVKKTYYGAWTMSKQISGFTGDYVLQGGGVVTVSSGTRYYFGAESKAGGKLVIMTGNTLYVPNTGGWAVMGNRPVHIAGTGYNSMGAVNTGYAYSTSAEFIKYLHLDDDALLYINGPAYYQFFSNAEIDMHGHELTLGGNGDMQLTGTTTVSTNGTLRIRGASASARAMVTMRSVSGSFSVDSEYTDSPFLIDDYGTLAFYIDGVNRTKKANRHLWVKGTNGSLITRSQGTLTGTDWSSLNILNWAGPVIFKDEGAMSLLSLHANDPRLQLTVSGQVSGNGSLKTTSSNVGRVYFANTNNTYTGYTYFDNIGSVAHGCGSVLLAGPGSVPNYSSVTCSYGFASVRLKERESDDEVLWDAASIARLANEATWLNDAAVGLDTTYGESPFTMQFPATTNSIGGVGPGEVVLTNVATTAERRLNVKQGGGVLRFKGDGDSAPIHVGKINVTEPVTNCTESTVVFDGCDLVYDDESDFRANGVKRISTTVRTRPVTRIALKDTRLVDSTLGNAWSDLMTGAIVAGGLSGEAAVEILSGSVVTARLVAAGRVYGGHGAFYQRGGIVTALGNASSTFENGTCIGSAGFGGHNHGFYELSDGELTACGRFAIGRMERGVFFQTGGRFTMTNALNDTATPRIGIGVGNGYGGSLCVFGGTFDASAGSPEINSGYSGSSQQFATVSAAGPTAYIDFGPDANWVNNNDTSCTIFTICDGGRMRTQGVHKNKLASTLIVNFNNGTWVPTQNGNGGAEDIFHTHRSLNVNYGPAEHVLVYSGGMTIDTDGKTGVYTYRPIEGATGGGVTSVAATPVYNICGAPVVRIDGDGYGAVGVADYDSVSNVVRGVRILAPGAGYTYATAKLMYGREMSFATYDCTISENSNTGGFTKTGEGSFILYATNTWGGATTVAGGTLKAGCDWAVPPGSGLVLSGGGVMDFNGKTGEVASVTYGAGGGSIANAEFVKIPNSASVTISVDELLAGKKVSFAGDVDLDALEVTLTGDLGKLSEGDRRYTLIEAEGALSGSADVVTEGALPDGWSFKTGGKRLMLAFSKGMLLMIM